MKNNLILILTLLLSIHLIGCNNESRTEYVNYYNESKKNIKVRGQLTNNIESGTWQYFEEDGSIAQEGNFENGFQVGKWIYRFKNYDSSITWKKYNKILNKLNFSLPDSFKETTQEIDLFEFSATNSQNKDRFSIKGYNNANQVDLNSYDSLNIVGFRRENFEILNTNSMLVIYDSTNYYLNKYHLFHKSSNSDFVMYNICTLVEDNLLIFSYTGKTQDSTNFRFLLGEIFYHTTFNQKRLADPLIGIKEIIKK